MLASQLRVGQLLALAAALLHLVLVGAPDVRVGVGAQIALAVDEDRRDAAQEKLLDDGERERGLARAGAAEHRRMALEDVLVEAYRPARLFQPKCRSRISTK